MKATTTNNINILEFIGSGKDNAKSRRRLCEELHLPDRTIRNLIHDARREGAPIVNIGDGDGYYIVDKNNEEELQELYAYINMMKSRQADISETVRSLTVWAINNA